MCKVPTGRALCARIANTVLVAVVLTATYAVGKGHQHPAASVHPGTMTAIHVMPAATRCGPPTNPAPGSEYEWSNSVGPPAGPLPSWWTIALPAWPTRT